MTTWKRALRITLCLLPVAAAAAYLTALMNGETPSDCAKLAAAEGAASVSSYDALGGILPLEELKKRIAEYEGGRRTCL